MKSGKKEVFPNLNEIGEKNKTNCLLESRTACGNSPPLKEEHSHSYRVPSKKFTPTTEGLMLQEFSPLPIVSHDFNENGKEVRVYNHLE